MGYVKPILPTGIAPVSQALSLQNLNWSGPASYNAQIGTVLNAIMTALNSACFSVAGSAVATTKAKAKTVNAAQYTIGGFAYTKAGTDNLWTLDTTCNVTNGNWNGVWLYLDASGTASIAAGTQATTQAGIVMPTPDITKCVIAYLTINPTGTGNFTGGSTALDDGTVIPNAAFYDVTFPGVLTLLT